MGIFDMERLIELNALGKRWGKLVDGRYLEVGRRGNRTARIDLVETARTGRAVIVKDAPKPEEKPHE